MKKLTGVSFVLIGAVILGVLAAFIVAAAPVQAALPGGPAYQATTVPPAQNPTVVVIPQTGTDTETAPASGGWLVPVIIIVGIGLVVLFAVALAGRGTNRTDV